jgi:hypothetical protein
MDGVSELGESRIEHGFRRNDLIVAILPGAWCFFGGSRPPVTLRFVLGAMSRARGALPLAPATMAFVDATHEERLGLQPAIAKERLGIDYQVGDLAPLAALRGEFILTLFADRARLNRKGMLLFMIDLAFELSLGESRSQVSLSSARGKGDPGWEQPAPYLESNLGVPAGSLELADSESKNGRRSGSFIDNRPPERM